MEELTYEDAVKELNNIITQLEEGNLSMSKALELFEKGQVLIKFCYQKLDAAKGKITEIKEVLNNLEEV